MNILRSGDKKAIALAERKQRAQKLVDSVLKYHGKERWLATRQLWLFVDPNAYRDHWAAIDEARELRKTLLDPSGKSRQTLGIAYGEKGNKNTYRRLISVFPDDLKTMLKRFDPFNLAIPKGVRAREMWREVYETFPEYQVAEKVR